MQPYPQQPLSAFESFIIHRVRKSDEWSARKRHFDIVFFVINTGVTLVGSAVFVALIFILHIDAEHDYRSLFSLGQIVFSAIAIVTILLFILKSYIVGEAPVIPGGDAKLLLNVVKPDTVDLRQEGGEYYHPRHPNQG